MITGDEGLGMEPFYPLTPEGVAKGLADAMNPEVKAKALAWMNSDPWSALAAAPGVPLKKKGKSVPGLSWPEAAANYAAEKTCLMFENAPWPEWWLDAVMSGQMADVCEIARAAGRKIDELEAVVLLAAG